MRRRSLVLLTLLLIGLALIAWIGSALLPVDPAHPVWQSPLIQTLVPTPTAIPGWWQKLVSPTPLSTTPIP